MVNQELFSIKQLFLSIAEITLIFFFSLLFVSCNKGNENSGKVNFNKQVTSIEPIFFNSSIKDSYNPSPVSIDLSSFHEGFIGKKRAMLYSFKKTFNCDIYTSVVITYSIHRTAAANEAIWQTNLSRINKKPKIINNKFSQKHNNKVLKIPNNIIFLYFKKSNDKKFYLSRKAGLALPPNNKKRRLIRIDLQSKHLWYGKLDKLAIRILEVSNSLYYKIEKIEFLPQQKSIFKRNRRITIKSISHRGKITDISSSLYVDLKPVGEVALELWYALGKIKKIKPISPVIFRISIHNEINKDKILYEKEIGKQSSENNHWFKVHLSLKKWRSKRIQLHFETFAAKNNRIANMGQYAAWSSPYLLHYSKPLKDNKPDIILISLDTLRADMLGCYGSPDNISPNLDKLAKNSILFANTITQAPNTSPAHASLLTSLYPYQHDLVLGSQFLSSKHITLASILAKHGWFTAALTGGVKMAARTCLDQGFYSFNTRYSRREGVIKYVLPWLKKHQNLPYFFFYHTYHIHGPYHFNKEITPDFTNLKLKLKGNEILNNPILPELSTDQRNYLKALYKTGIREMDSVLGTLFENLYQTHKRKKLLIAVVSDHGEQFGEKENLFGHCNSLYDELLKVPLIINFNAMKNTKHNHFYNETSVSKSDNQNQSDFTSSQDKSIYLPQVSLVDFLPTLLDYLNINPPDDIVGKSLLRKNNYNNEETSLSEMTYQYNILKEPEAKMSMRTQQEKLIYSLNSDKIDYYNLKTGKEIQVKDNFFKNNENEKNLKKQLEAYVNKRRNKQQNREELLMRKETIDQLKALGYVNTN